MRLHLIKDRDDDDVWHVWATLDHTEREYVTTATESFIIASGSSIAEAMSNAEDEAKLSLSRLRQDLAAQL